MNVIIEKYLYDSEVLPLFIMTRTMLIEKGNSDKVIERFSQPGPMDEMEGLIDISVMVNKKSKEQEEVVIV